ncbi:MAG: alpha-2-macroglobulin [Bacteroidetes bacterium]|nr:alpha-2-macroglobulin [Bacteroidota bacterium]
MTTAFAQQQDDYASDWKKVEGLEKKGLTASALKEVIGIFNKALLNNNEPQQIKSAIYQVKYRNLVEENSVPSNILYIDTLIEKSKAPVMNILQSMKAELLWNFKNRNRYLFYSRTRITDDNATDILTWSIDKFNNSIAALYNASLSQETLLQNTALNNWDAILQKGINSRDLRPSLYDFLAHRAIAFFGNAENDVTNPAYKFIINDEHVFDPANEFINLKIATTDAQSLYYRALLIYQDILRFHINDKDPGALIDADLLRLTFVNRYAVISNKTKLYEAALQFIETKYSHHVASGAAIFLQAQLYQQSGSNFHPFTNKEVQYDLVKATQLCEKLIAAFPHSEAADRATNLLFSIKSPQLKIETEKVNIPGVPFLSLVSYRNIETLYFRVVKSNRNEIQKIRSDNNMWKLATALTPVLSWKTDLPQQQDFQQHSTEIKTGALETGMYIILASISPDFSIANNIIGWQTTYVSNISYIDNNNNELYVLNRNDGRPIPNTNLQLWESRYNDKKGIYEDVKLAKYTADQDGYIKVKKSKSYYNTYYQLYNGNDELFTDDANYNYEYNNQDTVRFRKKTFLFTDRGIYRPGQLVHFKGIVVSKEVKSGRSNIVTGFKSNIRLIDVNGEIVQRLQLTTNEFGSFSGSFTLPENLLNGSFTVSDSITESYTSFNVEEYKRPKFRVEVKKPSGTYRVNDSIEVKGLAQAYAGNKIDGANVTYRVTRKVNYPVWRSWGYRLLPYPQPSPMEITTGQTKTDKNGEFTIIFKAIPDETINKADQPIFNYEVSADITDLNGETRSGNANVQVAYQSVQLSITSADNLLLDSLHTIKVSSKNMNGLFEQTVVQVKFLQLQQPATIYRDRFWQIPDQFVMSREAFEKDFPYDAYADENQMNKWTVTDSIINTDSTNENAAFTFTHKPTKEGWYKIVATTVDKYGETASTENYIYLKGNSVHPISKPVLLTSNQSILHPGEKLQYTIETGFSRVHLIHSVTRMQTPSVTTKSTVQSGKPFSNELSITDNDRGGLDIDYAFVQHNRVYSGSKRIYIPWDNKDLKITYETFRDKVLPGSEEKWKINITGSKAEKVAAEALINMYDASLDQFSVTSWEDIKSLWPLLTDQLTWKANGFAAVSAFFMNRLKNERVQVKAKTYDRLIAGWSEGDLYYRRREDVVYEWDSNASFSMSTAGINGALEGRVSGLTLKKSKSVKEEEFKVAAPVAVSKGNVDGDGIVDVLEAGNGNYTEDGNIQVRKNFNENAFFFPSLQTDANGNISFSFTMPEALTSWNMMTLAHTKDLSSVFSVKSVITQKPLMVQPNAPRFLRENDRMEFSVKVVNVSDSELTGTTQLELLDATTNKPVDGWFKNIFPVQYFTVAAGQSTVVKFPIDIPNGFNSALLYRVKAVATKESFSDGEEAAMPVLINRELVTESMPLNMRNETSKNFKFEKLLTSNNSNTLTHQSFTIEYTSNPAWYAVQSLPYLMEYPYECAEQNFNRYYANTLASYVSNSTPKIKAVFEKWKNSDSSALLSNLQKNESLKSALLQETPWVLAAKNEQEQKKNIAVLFDMVRLSKEKAATLNKLKELQNAMGAFSWFKGGPDDRYMTQYILTGIGHLIKLHALTDEEYSNIKPVIERALPYLDSKLKEEYDALKRNTKDMKANHLSYTAIQFLYMRSFFSAFPVAGNTQTALNYFKQQSQQYWLQKSKYMQAMIALALSRMNDSKTPVAIIASLKENAILSEEMGMYWKEFTARGYYWYQSPVESQSLMIEAFAEIDKNTITVDNLKTWLLKQKQTQHWGTTRATAEACYALLMNGSKWLQEEKNIVINAGNTTIKSADETTEAGTGYFKKIIPGEKVQQGMGNITVTVSGNQQNKSASWGAVYWQYFEDLDKITAAETPLKLVKKIFVEKNTDRGQELVAVNEGDELHVGDKIKVRIELRADRDMEYVHMKDMRAACMEPVNVLSEYKWQGGLGYYESTKDASTNFFFNWLPKGTYVFEYPVFVTHSGNFSNGITTIQCMYAPEFTSHSEGIRVSVE